ncbi:MAG: hypothetical protein QW332_06165 [Thermoproteota archaeon]
MFSIEELRKSVDETLNKLEEMKKSIEESQNVIREQMKKLLESYAFSNIDNDLLKEFLEEPYVLLPKRENEWYVVVPKFYPFQVGWLERTTKGYNIFVINRYVKWFTDIPISIQKKLKFPEPKPFKIYDGMLLTGKEHQEEAFEKYREYLSHREGEDRIAIKKGLEFKLIAKLIEDGTLPFVPQPVREEDLRDFPPYSEPIKLRGYQEEAWKKFLETGAVGVFWAFGSGKSFLGLYALARIKGNKLVVVPSITLVEQWLERIRKYIPWCIRETKVHTYHAYDKIKDEEFNLVIFDECQHLPANTFIKLATIKAKYRMGFSGSPYREDGRESYIIALTGFPIGMSWEELIKMRVVKQPDFRVFILDSERAKIRKLEELLRIPMKTIIFCDNIDLGQRIAKMLNIPFVYGATKERLEIIRESDTCVVSRVGDEGISIPDIERIIEISFLYGSRMQESQRFGRLMHADTEKPEHIILMTEEEYEKYNKRLYAILERGFKLEVIR